MEDHPVWLEHQKKLEMLRSGTGDSFGQPIPDPPAEEFGRQVIGSSLLGTFSTENMSVEEGVCLGSRDFPINLAPPGKKKRHKKNL